MYPFLSLYGDWPLLVLRVVSGLILIVHGWPKIKELKANAGNFSAMGFRPGWFWGTLVAVVEFFGGLVLIAGFYAQAAALLVAGEFFVIIFWKIAKKQPFIGAFEFDILIFAAAFVLAVLGAGAFSLDRYPFWSGF